jgi:secreted trypsin-like serine protease
MISAKNLATFSVNILLIYSSLVSSTLIDDRQRNLKSRIIQGRVANATRYPYYTYLDILRSGDTLGRCGGSLVASDVVLTAAHCINNYKPIKRITVKVNYTRAIDVTGQPTGFEYVRAVTRRIWFNNESDLGLLLLDTPISEVIPIQLNNVRNLPYVGQLLTVVGHGTMTFGERNRPDYLMEVSVPVISHEDCNDSNSYDGGIIKRTMICAGAGGKDSCSGDSGGPLVILGTNPAEDLQVGIVSSGYQCGLANFPGIYTRVSNYFQLIHTIICQISNDKPLSCFDSTPSPATNPTMKTIKIPTKYPAKKPTKKPTRNRTKRPTKMPNLVSTKLGPVTGSPTISQTRSPLDVL